MVLPPILANEYISWSGRLLSVLSYLRGFTSIQSASILERLVQRWSRVFCIVDTTKQVDYLPESALSIPRSR